MKQLQTLLFFFWRSGFSGQPVRSGLTGFDRAGAQTTDHASVIMYHRFDEPKYPSTNIALDQFEAHLKFLSENGYSVLPLGEIVSRLQSGEGVPDRTVAITIDDAYLSVYEKAWPLLQKYGFPFTLFVATEPIDRRLRGYMSWEQLREMQAAGMSIGSQTKTHPHLHRISPAEVAAELADSSARFLAELGLRPDCLPIRLANIRWLLQTLSNQLAFAPPLARIPASCTVMIYFLNCRALPLMKPTARLTG